MTKYKEDSTFNKISIYIKYRFVFCKIFKTIGIGNILLDSIPIGWKIAFGVPMCEDIKKEIKDKHIKKYKIHDMKEKFGHLMVYATHDLDCIDKYKDVSKRTCIICGKNAKMTCISGYINPICIDCFPSMRVKKSDYDKYVI